VTAAAVLSIAFQSLASAQQAEANIEEMTVTGSLVQVSGMTTPTPVTTVSTDELDSLAPGQLDESLAEMPQFLGNQLPESGGAFSTTEGQSCLNLRGLG
jgi:outer membrane receptor protein involved in Fe transport